MKLNKDKIYSKKGFFGIPTYYDIKKDIYFCTPKSKSFVSKFYSKNYWDNFSRKKINIFGKLGNIIFEFFNILDPYNYKNNKILKEKNIIIKSSKILEIGCGEGKNIIYLTKKGYNIEGIEIDKQNVEKINKKLKSKQVFLGNYEEIILRKKYDVIYLRHVLEHFYDINKVTKKLKNNLNKNGYIFIDVPFCEDEYTLKRSINKHPHIYHFTKKSLNSLFINNGYSNIFIEAQRITLNKKSKLDLILFLIKKIFKISIIEKYEKSKTKNTPCNLIGIFKLK